MTDDFCLWVDSYAEAAESITRARAAVGATPPLFPTTPEEDRLAEQAFLSPRCCPGPSMCAACLAHFQAYGEPEGEFDSPDGPPPF